MRPRIQPLRLVVLAFLALIGLGSVLLLLPAATPAGKPISPIDALFTATSAVCVTGLVVRDTGSEFTLFGQMVILVLIQLGGLGVMTFSLLVFSLFGGRGSMAQRQIARLRVGGGIELRELWPMLRLVARFTVAVELIGALLLFAHWYPHLGPAEGLYAAVFHSVSAFCNAGFSVWRTSLIDYRGDLFVNLVIAGLIVLGGLGYLVFYDLLEARTRRGRLTLHTRLALAVSGTLIAVGAALIWALERRESFASLTPLEGFLASLFQSVTTRTAGFNTVDIAALSPATLFLMIVLMFIGGSPGSCAGGIKTTTFGVLVIASWSRLRNRRNISVFRRTIGSRSLANALTVTIAGAVVLLTGLFALLLVESPDATEPDAHGVFLGYFFETASALGTVGLSTGITSTLLPVSRLMVALLMFLGRLGPLTVAAALSRESPAHDWRYAEEDVVIG